MIVTMMMVKINNGEDGDDDDTIAMMVMKIERMVKIVLRPRRSLNENGVKELVINEALAVIYPDWWVMMAMVTKWWVVTESVWQWHSPSLLTSTEMQ
jgi:hypothetical protein